MWIKSWIRLHKEVLIDSSFLVLGMLTFALYWPLRAMMIEQEARASVHVGELTVVIILLVAFISWGIGKVIDKRLLKGRSWLLRQVAWLACLVVILVYLDLVGLDFRW